MAESLPQGRMRLDIVSDAICPWCYIGKRHMEAALALLEPEGIRFEIHWNPFQLNPDMPREGVDRRTYRAQKFGSLERSQQMDARVSAAAANAGLAFNYELLQRTPNTLQAHRLISRAGREGKQGAVMEAIFRSYFTQGGDIGTSEILTACAVEGGMDGTAVEKFLATDEGLAEIVAMEQAARSAGVSGVPSFFLEGHPLFSGAMPAEEMANAFRRAHGILNQQAQAAE